jgi:hemerythrin-like domain-containing protein
MELASSQFQDSPGVSGRRWAQAAAEYTNLLREHIAKENEVLFCMAESLLTNEEQERLAPGIRADGGPEDGGRNPRTPAL